MVRKHYVLVVNRKPEYYRATPAKKSALAVSLTPRGKFILILSRGKSGRISGIRHLD
jgi:hypothetical protein